MLPDVINTFMKASAVSSKLIYKSIEEGISLTRLSVENLCIAAACREKLSESGVAVSSCINTFLDDLPQHWDNIDNLLTFGGFFDHTPEKEARLAATQKKALGVGAQLSSCVSSLVFLAEKNVVSDFLLENGNVDRPREKIWENNNNIICHAANTLASLNKREKLGTFMWCQCKEMAEQFPDVAAEQVPFIEEYRQRMVLERKVMEKKMRTLPAMIL